MNAYDDTSDIRAADKAIHEQAIQLGRLSPFQRNIAAEKAMGKEVDGEREAVRIEFQRTGYYLNEYQLNELGIRRTR